MCVPKEIFFRTDITSPLDKGDLGGFFHRKSSSKNTLKLFMRHAGADPSYTAKNLRKHHILN